MHLQRKFEGNTEGSYWCKKDVLVGTKFSAYTCKSKWPVLFKLSDTELDWLSRSLFTVLGSPPVLVVWVYQFSSMTRLGLGNALQKSVSNSAQCVNLKMNSALLPFVSLLQCYSTCNSKHFITVLLIWLMLDLRHRDPFYFYHLWNCKYSCSWTPESFNAFCELKW